MFHLKMFLTLEGNERSFLQMAPFHNKGRFFDCVLYPNTIYNS